MLLRSSLGTQSFFASALGAAALSICIVLNLPTIAHADCINSYGIGAVAPNGYGIAWNPFSPSRELLVQATTCSAGSAIMSVGSGDTAQYVYNKGYFWTGSQWKLYTLSGTSELKSNAWYTGKATGNIELPQTTTYVVGYVCQRSNGVWKCGCRDAGCATAYWQLQGVANRPTSNLSDGAVVWTGVNGNSYYVDRTTIPVKDYSIQDLGEGEFRFKVINGDLAGSATRERSELVGQDEYAWGTDIWVNMERIIDHYAAGVHDVIAGQFHDVPTSGLGPPVSLSIDENGREVVTVGYKYSTHADHEQIFPVRSAAELGSWVKWIVHVKTGLQGGGALSTTTYGETGRVEVWRWGKNDTGYVKVIDYSGDVGYESYRNSLRLQFGIYSQGTNGAPSHDDGSDSERTLRFRNFYSGTTPLM